MRKKSTVLFLVLVTFIFSGCGSVKDTHITHGYITDIGLACGEQQITFITKGAEYIDNVKTADIIKVNDTTCAYKGSIDESIFNKEVILYWNEADSKCTLCTITDYKIK